MENTMTTLTWEERNRLRLTERQRVRDSRSHESEALKEERINKAFFQVVKVNAGKNKNYIINMETGDKISEVSDIYCLVKNADVFKPFIARFGFENVTKCYGYGNGKYYYMEINTGRRFNFGTEEKPDWIDEKIIIINSYNKTKSFSFKIGAFRWTCANTLYSGEVFESYKKKHVGEIPVMKIVFDAMLKYSDNSFDLFKDLKNTPLTLEQEKEIISRFNTKVIEKDNETPENLERINKEVKKVASYLVEKPESIDNPRNAWGLYNQLNSAILNSIRGKAKVGERISANSRLNEFMKVEVN